MKEIRLRCWVDINGEKFFGPGPARLLLMIEEEGSIARAAKKMGMSYKKAWDLIHNLNTKGSSPYVVSQKGGQKGGGAELTTKGKEVVAAYQNLVHKLESVIESDQHLINQL
ncbi:winged helix-turn-helix domain-containing protein [Marinoscillum sp.]|uniref:winged helix-turn-helix domain-containing protein n=1 Tax=Marinoscillum sp. TaxID=2024838 RepID=UPI003BA973CD